jgi:hypothetical protein
MEEHGGNKKHIGDYKKDYEFYTGKASELNRNLAFGGIAIIWIFKTTSEGGIGLPNELIQPLIWLICALSLDLLQYISGGLIWLIYYRWQEGRINKAQINANSDMKAHPILPGIIHFFYWTKIGANIAAYFFLFKFLMSIFLV